MPIVLKSGSLILLEPSVSVQACNGIAVPLHEHSFVYRLYKVRRRHSKHDTIIVTLYIQHFTWILEYVCDITRDTYKVYIYIYIYDRLCGLVVRVSGYRYRGPGFDPRRYQIF